MAAWNIKIKKKRGKFTKYMLKAKIAQTTFLNVKLISFHALNSQS
jgi:hypothetical protein